MFEIENPKRLPKQMKHWLNRAGIYGSGRYERRYNYFYGSSRKKKFTAGTATQRRHFRVLPHLDRMDICDGNFDRWANSMGASIHPIPRTQAEFDAAITTLVKKAAKKAKALREAVEHEEMPYR